jgi:uncharacterized protein (TIGR00297 family)
MNRFALGAVFAGSIAGLAYRAKTLTADGAVAAFGVGTLTFGCLGVPGASVLLTFFVSSIALSRVDRTRKRTVLVDVEKPSARDGAQVLANGGIAALCACFAATGEPRLAIAFAGAFSAATADTWGTEIGTLVRQRPHSILTLRPIATGLSGGVTLVGMLAECAGALTIAAVASRLLRPRAFAATALAGIAGATVDSLLGASVQSLRWCTICRRPTERRIHECDTPTAPLRGLTFFENDGVNAVATLTGAIVAYALAPSRIT